MVGCDNVLESGMKADACGVCNGSNYTAHLVVKSATKLVNFGNKTICTYRMYVRNCVYSLGYTDVIEIPAGARHVKVLDTGVSGNYTFIGTYVGNSYVRIL